MEMPKLDIPTDNLYKFGAILSTALCIACLFAIAYLGQQHNDQVLNYLYKYVDYSFKERAESNNPSADSNITTLTKSINRLIEIEKKNVDIFIYVLSFIFGASLVASIYFYILWYRKVQVHLDKLLELKLKKEEANNITSPILQIAGAASKKKDKSKQEKQFRIIKQKQIFYQG